MVKSASDAAQKLVTSRRLRNTQGERILWVDLANMVWVK